MNSLSSVIKKVKSRKRRLSLILSGTLLCLLAGTRLCAWGVGSSEARWPEASGSAVESNGKLQLDVSNKSEGYFYASVPGGASHRLKLRVEKDGMTLTYDLNTNGEAEIFPLQLGSGSYTISLYENVGGKKYAQQGGASLYTELSREDVAFLYPNQYINYNQYSMLVEKAAALCDGLDEESTYKMVCDFMSSEFVYDFVRAITISAGELPDLDGCFDKRMGICQDLSGVMVAMLRTLGIPGRMIIGYADNNYHAWTMTNVNGEDKFFDPTAAVGGISTIKDYSTERYY